jgi:putative tricarboxylic transport membrane protein
MRVNMITGLLLFILCVVLYLLIPSQITMIETKRLSMSPAFYPRVVIITMAILSLAFVLSSYRNSRKAPDPTSPAEQGKGGPILGEDSLRTLITVAIMLGYIYLIEWIGFLLATPIGLGALMVHMGNRRLRVLCLVMIGVPLVLYLVFERIMLVILPRGLLF